LDRNEHSEDGYRFFPGCLAKLKLPHIERSVRLVLADLGIRLLDEQRFTCCPDPVVFRSASREEWLKLAALNLSLDDTLPILTLCPGCSSSLSEARHIILNHKETSKKLDDRLDSLNLRLKTPQVSHFLRVLSGSGLMDVISQKILRTFEHLKVTCHYGCHLVRPSPAVGFDDPEKPTSLDDLVGLLGAESVDYEDKYLCCGRPSIDEETSLSIAEHKLTCMKDAGSQMIVVACPFCFEQFDLGQVVIARRKGADFSLPVLYVTQLLGLAMGLKGVYEDE
jgi:heterodisulfide reductase subunit B